MKSDATHSLVFGALVAQQPSAPAEHHAMARTRRASLHRPLKAFGARLMRLWRVRAAK